MSANQDYTASSTKVYFGTGLREVEDYDMRGAWQEDDWKMIAERNAKRDQWQRRRAEFESPNPAKKRAGAVPLEIIHSLRSDLDLGTRADSGIDMDLESSPNSGGRQSHLSLKKGETLTLTCEQLDRLIAALVEASWVRESVKEARWEQITTVMSGEFNVKDNFHTTSIPSLCGSRITPKPRRKSPAAQVSADICGIALANPAVHGTSIRCTSRPCGPDTRLQVGACAEVDLEHGTEPFSALRVEPRSESSRPQVIFQTAHQALERRKGIPADVLLVEMEVTAIFQNAVKAELAAMTGADVVEVCASPGPSPTAPSESIDWSAAADDEVTTVEATGSVIGNACAILSGLTAETCSVLTLALPSTLEWLAARHQDFIVLRPSSFHDNGVPASVGMPWQSRHLASIMADTAIPEDVQRHLRYLVMCAVSGLLATNERVEKSIVWNGSVSRVQCVALWAVLQEGPRPEAWICFLKTERC